MFWVGKVRLTIEHYNIDWIGFITVSFSVCHTFQYFLSHSGWCLIDFWIKSNFKPPFLSKRINRVNNRLLNIYVSGLKQPIIDPEQGN